MSELKSLDDLFEKSIFKIPNYQRGYSWELQQLEEFWEDVFSLPDDKDHYTGMISLKELDKEEDKENLIKWNEENWLIEERKFRPYHVVDGQQRLTTIIILIKNIIELYDKKHKEKNPKITTDQIIIEQTSTRLSDVIEKYLVINKPKSVIKSYLFGYEVDKPSDDYFKYKILGEKKDKDLNESFYTINLDKADEFFKEKLNKLYNKNNDFEAIGNLFKTITQRLKFNKYVISQDFNINVAFETMNNRGKKLSTLEILKNRLVYLTTLLNLPKDEEKNLTTSINDTWKNIYANLGKDKDKALDDDDFLLAHSYIYFGYTEGIKKGYANFLLKSYFNKSRIFINSITEENEDDSISDINVDNPIIDNETYDKVNLNKKLTDIDIYDYIESLNTLVTYWYNLHYPDMNNNNNEKLNDWLLKLNRLDFNFFRPLTLVVLSRSDISYEKKIKVFEKIERYIFLNFRLAGYQTTYSRSTFYKLTHRLYLGLEKIDNIIEQLDKIVCLSSNNVLNMNIGVLSVITRIFKGDGFYQWTPIRYFLSEYESYLLKKVDGVGRTLTEKYFRPSKSSNVISIEHIFPQSEPTDTWLIKFEKYSNQERNSLKGTLGNLLPLANDINKALQADSFEKKKIRYKIGSYSENEVASYNDWTSEEILNRGMKIISFMEERWDFKFHNKYDKYVFLGLEFMVNDIDKETDVIDIIEEKEIDNDNKYKRENYSLEYHLSDTSTTNNDLFEKLNQKVLQIDNSIKMIITKNYVGYCINNNFLEIHFKKDGLQIFILPRDDYNDINNRLRVVPDSYNWKINTTMYIYNEEDIEYALEFIKKSYDSIMEIL